MLDIQRTITKAVVLAAGMGKRMRPLTDHLPKPMIEIAGSSMLERVLVKVAEEGVTQIVINSHYKAEILEAYLHERLRAHPTPPIIISREETLLETGGGVVKVLPYLGDAPFFVINSDILWVDGVVPALKRLRERWNPDEMDALLLVHKVKKAVGYDGEGDFILRESGELVRTTDPIHPFVYTGVQILSPRLFRDAPEGGFSLNVLYARGRKPDGTLHRIYGLEHDGDWLHIGTPEAVGLAENFLAENASNR